MNELPQVAEVAANSNTAFRLTSSPFTPGPQIGRLPVIPCPHPGPDTNPRPAVDTTHPRRCRAWLLPWPGIGWRGAATAGQDRSRAACGYLTGCRSCVRAAG
jgi:hypothetical protein